MSTTVDMAEVRRAIDAFGPRATLVSVGDTGAPHVVTAIVTATATAAATATGADGAPGDGGARLLVEVGSRTRANLAARPALSLVWDPPRGEYQLILDARAERIGEPDERGVAPITVTVDSGILHRLAGLPAGPSTCVALADLDPARA